jgi:hypothetical protein
MSLNIIWVIDGENETTATSFDDIASTCVYHFQNIFKEDSRASIDSILQVAFIFPRFINREENDKLMEKITKKNF